MSPSPWEGGPGRKQAWCFKILLWRSWQRCDGRAWLGVEMPGWPHLQETGVSQRKLGRKIVLSSKTLPGN